MVHRRAGRPRSDREARPGHHPDSQLPTERRSRVRPPSRGRPLRRRVGRASPSGGVRDRLRRRALRDPDLPSGRGDGEGSRRLPVARSARSVVPRRSAGPDPAHPKGDAVRDPVPVRPRRDLRTGEVPSRIRADLHRHGDRPGVRTRSLRQAAADRARDESRRDPGRRQVPFDSPPLTRRPRHPDQHAGVAPDPRRSCTTPAALPIP